MCARWRPASKGSTRTLDVGQQAALADHLQLVGHELGAADDPAQHRLVEHRPPAAAASRRRTARAGACRAARPAAPPRPALWWVSSEPISSRMYSGVCSRPFSMAMSNERMRRGLGLQRGVAAGRVHHEPLRGDALGEGLPPAVLAAVAHQPQQRVALVVGVDAVDAHQLAHVGQLRDALARLQPGDLGGRARHLLGDLVEREARRGPQPAQLSPQPAPGADRTLWCSHDPPLSSRDRPARPSLRRPGDCAGRRRYAIAQGTVLRQSTHQPSRGGSHLADAPAPPRGGGHHDRHDDHPSGDHSDHRGAARALPTPRARRRPANRGPRRPSRSRPRRPREPAVRRPAGTTRNRERGTTMQSVGKVSVQRTRRGRWSP